MEYLDLSPYDYSEYLIPMSCVAWLGSENGVQGSSEPMMSHRVLEALECASRRLGTRSLGVHECEFCPKESPFVGNGEYRYYASSDAVYVAPMMVLHYVNDHGYRLPAEFQASLIDSSELEWDWRAERLSEIVLSSSADIDLRGGAIIDLAHWKEHRSLEALELAALDDELVDLMGEEIGLSLGEILRTLQGKGLSIRGEELAPEVRAGIDRAFR